MNLNSFSKQIFQCNFGPTYQDAIIRTILEAGFQSVDFTLSYFLRDRCTPI